ncbi:OmpA/MotB family protein [Pseudomonas japonica]
MNHATAVADNRYWLERQRSLEFELTKARERQCNLKRAAGAPDLLGVPLAEGESDGWMLTYLDLITVLLVMVMAMLAQALIQRHPPLETAPARVLDIAGLTRVEPPGSLLRVPAVVAPPVVEPIVETPPEPVVAAPVPEEPANPLADLPLEQLGSDIEVIRNERSVSFRIDSSILFHSGQADLDPKGLEVLQRLAGVLKDLPHRIIVAGHTDARRVRNDRYPSNWELSGARAGSVVRFLQQQGIAPGRMTAMGMAGTQPLADNGSVEGRERNRRVELTLEKREGS